MLSLTPNKSFKVKRESKNNIFFSNKKKQNLQMSLNTSFSEMSPSTSAYLSIPPGTQYPAETDQIYQRAFMTTKRNAQNVMPRELYGYEMSNYSLDNVAMMSGGLNCQNTNKLGGRPNKDPAVYSGTCSAPRHPEQNSAIINAAFVDARQGAERYADKIGMYNYSMGDVDIESTLLGSPPLSVQTDAAKGTVVHRDGSTWTSFTGLKGLNYPPAIVANFYSPLAASTLNKGQCIISNQYSSNTSFCNNGM
jgi:hypothetical protein